MTDDYKLYLINKIIIDVAFAASLECKRERFEQKSQYCICMTRIFMNAMKL